VYCGAVWCHGLLPPFQRKRVFLPDILLFDPEAGSSKYIQETVTVHVGKYSVINNSSIFVDFMI
jgi:hypothetical protein